MDRSLVAWGRAVKARRRGSRLPPLWLFTDPERTPDVIAAVRALPPGLCGVVFRHGDAALLRRVAALCRERRLVLSVSGRFPLPPRAGRHGRGGRRVRGRLLTSAAHGRADLNRAVRAGAEIMFLSPVFPTASHPGAASLGPSRWGKLTRSCRRGAAALGGVTGANVRRLPRWVTAVGAIGALLP